MRQSGKDFHVLNTVTEYTRFYGLPAPAHPLLTVIDLGSLKNQPKESVAKAVITPVVQQLYMVSLKRNLQGAAIRYGHQSYDFNEGVLSFLSPGQGCWWAGAGREEAQAVNWEEVSGWTLLFHPDLLGKYPLGRKITQYGFFPTRFTKPCTCRQGRKVSWMRWWKRFGKKTNGPSTPSVRTSF